MISFILYFVLSFAHATPGQPIITSGGTARTFLPLNVQNTCQIITGSLTPTSSAVSAPKCSMYMSTGTGSVYIKQDAGSSTNWNALGTVSFVAPTVQKFLTTGSTTGWVFTISTSSTLAAGDTYTNNANTYTVLAALTAQTGQVLFTSGASAPTASGTLTRSAGAGTASITFTAAGALGTYTTHTSPSPLYIRVRALGGGSGGTGSSTAAANNGGASGAGGATLFGPNLIAAGGASAAAGGAGQVGGGGGGASLGTGPIGIAVPGATGTGSGEITTGANNFGFGAPGAASAFGGGGYGGGGNSAGQAATANTGAGGGGAGIPQLGTSGAGGGSGGFVDAMITSSVAATYVYAIGGGGTAGAAGTSGFAGGAGASGFLEVTEYYQ